MGLDPVVNRLSSDFRGRTAGFALLMPSWSANSPRLIPVAPSSRNASSLRSTSRGICNRPVFYRAFAAQTNVEQNFDHPDFAGLEKRSSVRTRQREIRPRKVACETVLHTWGFPCESSGKSLPISVTALIQRVLFASIKL
jgi:hypothetical protein